MKIAIVTDIHYGEPAVIADRQSERGLELLNSAVATINNKIKPDVTLILGDLIDDAENENALQHLLAIKSSLAKIIAPAIIIPGNHDLPEKSFYEIIQRPPKWIDIKNVRIVPFIDPEAAGYNAVREQANLKLLIAARKNYQGKIIALQHVPVTALAICPSPYNYTNAEEIIKDMQDAQVSLSLSGHYHKGFDLEQDGIRFISFKALCEAPFPFYELEIQNNAIRLTEHLAAEQPL